jgi:hypothetical protein
VRKLDLAGLMLVLLSVGGAGLGGSAEGGFGVTVAVALVMAIKLRLVCEHFLELGSATPPIRRLMYAFCYGMPALVILTTAFGPTIERLTAALI